MRDFVEAVRRVAEGGTALDPRRSPSCWVSADHGPLDELTARVQRDAMAEGRSNAAIAEELVVTEGAVEQRLEHLHELGLPPSEQHDHRRVLAVLTWMRG